MSVPRFVARLAMAASLAAGTPAAADEGMWPPDQLADVDAARLRRMGLTLAPAELWSDQGGVMRAAVNLSGCSAAFVSKQGLVLTNHHCVHRAVQRVSTTEKNLLRDGFLARTHGDELEGKGLTVTVLRRVTDVTARVRAAADAAKNDLDRQRAVQRAVREIVAECEKAPGARCTLGSLFRGAEHRLHEGVELRDVRLVYVPPAGVGEYGGDEDNWKWPRHTGDFALVRAWSAKGGAPADPSPDNVPHVPEHYLPIGHDGVQNGDFVASLGYPGETFRLATLAETRRFTDEILPATVDLYGEWLEALGRWARKSDTLRLAVASQKKSLANRHKNAIGRLEGIRANGLVERKESSRRRLESREKKSKEPSVLAELDEVTADASRTFPRDFLLANLGRGPNLLGIALDVARRAREAEKPDDERAEPYVERNLARTEKGLDQRLHVADARIDAELLAALVARAVALPPAVAIGPLASLAPGGTTDRSRIAKALAPKLRGTKLGDPAVARRAWKEATWAELQRSADPLVRLAVALVPFVEAAETAEHARTGRLLALAPRYLALLRATRRGPVYPDANGTLRISFAKVAGYSPEEGLTATPFTTLRGALAKHTGEDPFDLPERVRAKIADSRTSYWAAPGSEEVPACFLSNADTSGGNSGSPMIDGRGHLVGVNFDRVWENVSGDHGYSSKRSRNVSADVRYLLWMLDRVEDASELFEELGLAHLRSAPRRPSGAPSARPAASAPAPPPAAPSTEGRCSVGQSGGPGASPTALAVLAILSGASLARRRRGRGDEPTGTPGPPSGYGRTIAPCSDASQDSSS